MLSITAPIWFCHAAAEWCNHLTGHDFQRLIFTSQNSNHQTNGAWRGNSGGDLLVVEAVLLPDAIPAQGVVVEAGVLHQPHPLSPSGRHVGAVVFIQVLPEEGCAAT